MADKKIIQTIEGRVRELIADHGRLTALCAEMEAELTTLRAEKRTLLEEQKRLQEELQRKELGEGLSGDSKNRDKARARVNRLMREVDKCIALVGALER